MAALSKHYAGIVSQLSCTQVFHPGRTCYQYAYENFGKIFQLCAKFYTPMVLVSVEYIVETIIIYARFTHGTLVERNL